MKPVRFPSILAAFAFAFLFALAISNAAASSKPSAPPPPVDTRILIKSVDPKASTVTFKYMRDAKQSDHTYGVDSMTQVMLGAAAGKFADIKVGMVVDSYLERDNDNLDSLTLSGPGGSITPPKAKTSDKPKPKTSSSSSSNSSS